MKNKYTINIFTVSSENNQRVEDKASSENGADFETAITAAGFGKYNFLLYTILFVSCMSIFLASTSMSYIIPIAQCDLDLTLERKGMMNAVTYGGMITSAFLWGYLADTIGRRKCLIVSFLLDALFVFCGGLAQSFEMLVASKFMTGVAINGAFSSLTALYSEFHATKYRAKMTLINGILTSTCNIMLPILGLLILTKNMQIWLVDGFLMLHSWNVFILICALPSFINGLCYLYIVPESPRFLMSTGKNEEAMKVFRQIYSVNTGQHPDSYPIKVLKNESLLCSKGSTDSDKSTMEAVKEGLKQIQPLLYPPHVGRLVLLLVLQFGFFSGLNTIRLWLPQIFTAIADYKALHDNAETSMCDMLELVNVNRTVVNETESCYVNYENPSSYINNIIVSIVSLFSCVVAILLIGKTGRKLLLFSVGLASGISSIGIYFSKNEAVIVALSSITQSLGGVSVSIIISACVEMFPTNLRTMAVSLAMMFGRTGAIIGNLIFPILIQSGCLPPFFVIGFTIIFCTFLAMILPNTDNKALK